MIRSLLACAAILAAPAMAAPISDVSALPSADRAVINELEQEFFDLLSSQGADKGILMFFTILGSADKVTPEFRAKLREIDQKCGSASGVERVRSVTFGSRVVHDYFVVMHGSCPIRWDLTYVRRGSTWAFDRFNYLTFDGNEWTY